MNRHSGESIPSDTHEKDPGQYQVLSVPQLPPVPDYRVNIETVEPTHELLSVIWVPDVPKARSTQPLGAYATDAQKAQRLADKYPPHPIQPVPFTGYDPIKHRGGAQLSEHFEWVTVVTDGKLYLGLNDTEFAELSEALMPEKVVVLGQALRPVDPQTGVLHEAYSLPSLFGIDDSGQLHS